MQRHHVLPQQLRATRCFAPFLQSLGAAQMGFDDFRLNGLLLPNNESAALRMRLPLHRGPHRIYSEMVASRVGMIEAGWAASRHRSYASARDDALMRMRLLRTALRRRLLAHGTRPLRLNRHDPFGAEVDFTELDAMAELLWSATPVLSDSELS